MKAHGKSWALIGCLVLSPAVWAGTVSLTGEGSVKYAPDSVHLSFTASAEAPTVSAAQAETSREIQTWETQIKPERHKLSDYSTAQVGVYTRRQTDDQGHDTGKTMVVATQTVTFTLHDLKLLDTLLGAANTAGFRYQLTPADFFAADASGLQKQALAAAIKDAQEQCKFIAHQLGRQCGSVDTLDVNSQGPRPLMMKMSAVSNAQPSVTVGEQSLKVNVRATFKLR